MYFIKRGKVQLTHCVDKEEIGLFQLGTGNHFGEGALVNAAPRTANALALTYCHLLVLHRDDFNIVSANYPDLQHELMKTREKRPASNLKWATTKLTLASRFRKQMGGTKSTVAPSAPCDKDSPPPPVEEGARHSGISAVLNCRISRNAHASNSYECSNYAPSTAPLEGDLSAPAHPMRLRGTGSRRCSDFAASLVEEGDRISRIRAACQGMHSRVGAPAQNTLDGVRSCREAS